MFYLQMVMFIVWLLLCSFAILKISFFTKSGLSRGVLISLFLIKIVAGIAYALFYKLPQYYQTADTWRFYRLSLMETEWLLNNPLAFLKDLFVYGYDRPGNVFSGSNSYWNDLKSNVLVKLMAVCNVITFNNYYANIILFNFLYFFGFVGIYRALINIYTNKKWLLVAGIFFIPSTLFWCSGIHKDGLVISATGLIIYFFNQKIERKKFTLKSTLAIIICLLLIFSLRNYTALALVPGLFCWWIVTKTTLQAKFVFPAVYLVGILLFFFLPVIFPTLNFPGFLAGKQHEFMALAGGSEIMVQPLQPTFVGFLQYFPLAADMAFLRPHLSEAKGISSLLAFVEIIMSFTLLLLFIVFKEKVPQKQPITWFFIFFGLSILLIAGYTITFSGAIVRYRSYALPFIVTPMLCSINFTKLQLTIFGKKSN